MTSTLSILTSNSDLHWTRRRIWTADLPKPQTGAGSNDDYQVAKELAREFHSRSPWWIVGTSLAFEAVILALASWVFCRRDF